MTPNALRLAGTLAVVSLSVWACPEPEPNPCASDAFGCDNDDPGTLVFDDACTLTGDLDIEVGWGLDRFRVLESNGPEVYFGNQGGSHVFLAARFHNGDLIDHPNLEVRFQLYHVLPLESCAEELDWARNNNAGTLPDALRDDPDAGPEPALPLFVVSGDINAELLAPIGPSRCIRPVDDRTLLISDDDDIDVREDGSADVHSLFTPLPYVESLATMGVLVTATDPCRRTGAATASFVSP